MGSEAVRALRARWFALRQTVRPWRVVVALVAATVLGAPLWVPAACEQFFCRWHRVSLAEVEATTGVRFPPGSRLEHSVLGGFPDTEVQATIRVPAGRVKEFLAGLPQPHETYPLNSISVPALGLATSRSAPRWFTPESSRSFLAVKANLSAQNEKQTAQGKRRHEMLLLLIAFDKGRTPLVYLDWAAEG